MLVAEGKQISKGYCLDVRRKKWFHVGIKFEVIQGGKCDGNQSHFNLWTDAIKN